MMSGCTLPGRLKTFPYLSVNEMSMPRIEIGEDHETALDWLSFAIQSIEYP